jgi:hypothetical protein
MLACSLGLAAPGCGDAPGELIVVVTNDMVPPKDLDEVRVRVSVGDERKHDRTYSLDPDAAGGLKLPATIAILEGDDPLAKVDVRILGFRGGQPRTLNRVVTGVPHQRVGMIRLPIQWLCEGEVIESEPGVFESACEPQGGAAMACRAGACEAVSVSPETLPRFEASEAFGGSSQKNRANGRCFPASECFDAGFDARISEGTECTVVIAVETGAPVNFAIRTPSDGICSSSGCYVPLEKNDTLGWREVALGSALPPDTPGGQGGQGTSGESAGAAGDGDDSGSGQGGAPGSVRLRRFRLPEAVCTRVEDGRALGVRASTSERCGFTKTVRYPTCGSWSSVGTRGD